MIIIGLTGSIGMGKSTLAGMFERLGVPSHDSDAAVHALFHPDHEARTAIAAAFPYYEYPDLYNKKTRAIDRGVLGKIVFGNQGKREELESILHPRVRESQSEFIRQNQRLGRKMVVLDIPLLFETGAEQRVDYTVVASAPAHIQRARVLARPGMTDDKFDAILARQMPDTEKCARADFVVPTGLGRAHALRHLKDILKTIETAQI